MKNVSVSATFESIEGHIENFLGGDMDDVINDIINILGADIFDSINGLVSEDVGMALQDFVNGQLEVYSLAFCYFISMQYISYDSLLS